MSVQRTSQTPRRARREPPVDEATSARMRQAATFKAGGGGSLAVLILLLVSLLPLPIPVLPCIVIPGLVIVYASVGLLAGVLAGDHIYTSGQATQTGALAGFTCGIGGGVASMALAALGLIFNQLGPDVAEQLPEMQRTLTGLGMAGDAFPKLVAVMLALGICGAVGTLIALVFGALGGRIYFRLR